MPAEDNTPDEETGDEEAESDDDDEEEEERPPGRGRRPFPIPIPFPVPNPRPVPIPTPLPIPAPVPQPLPLPRPTDGPPPVPVPTPIPIPVPLPAPLPIPHPSPKPPPPAPPIPEMDPQGTYFVQLLATPHEDSICAIWDQLRAELPELFAYAERSITRVETGDNQVLFRLRVGAFLERAEAETFCQLLQGKGHNCFVTQRHSKAPKSAP